jgi:hypothetical protein
LHVVRDTGLRPVREALGIEYGGNP